MKTSIVLGGTSPHIELIKQLRKLGYYVILVDYLPDVPARKFADNFIRESTLDKAKVLQIAKESKAELVISACIDQANSTCCYVAERLGLPLPYGYETSLDVTDKGRMKRKMVAGEIPTSEFQIYRSLDDIDWARVSFPAVVKPVDCNSSKGVRRVDEVAEAKEFGQVALALSRTGCAIIEGFNKGIEIQVDCVVTGGRTQVVMTRQKKHAMSTNMVELNSTGSIIPALCCEGRKKELEDIGAKIAKSFGLRNTPFFYQAIVTEEGAIKVLEFAPRVGGGLSFYLLKELAGFDPVKAVIESFLGQSIEAKILTPCHLYSTNFLYMKAGVFDHVHGLENLKASGVIKEHFVMKVKGAKISGNLCSGNRVASFVIEGDTVAELEEKEKAAYASVDVLDEHGESKLMRFKP